MSKDSPAPPKDFKPDPKVMYEILSDVDFTSKQENEVCLDPEAFEGTPSGYATGITLARNPIDRTRFRIYQDIDDGINIRVLFDGYIFFDGKRIVFNREHPFVFRCRKMSRPYRWLLLRCLKLRVWFCGLWT